jgi:SPRY domain
MSFMPGVAGFPRPYIAPPVDPNALLPVSALYWRVRFPWANDNAGFRISELEMRAVEGGADQCSGGVASAFAGSGVANLFDRNTGTVWNGTNPGVSIYNAWVQYQFAAPVQVVEVAMTCDLSSQYTPRVVALDYSSDGVNWTMWAAWTNLAWDPVEQKILNAANRDVVPAGASPFWRLNVATNNGYANLELSEIEYRDAAGGSSATLTETISQIGLQASGNSWSSASLYDGDLASASYSAISASSLPAWNAVRFSGNHAFAQAAIRNRLSRTAAPKDFTFERSLDWGLTWEIVHAATSHIDWDWRQETRLFDLTQPSSVGVRGDWHIDVSRVAGNWLVSNLASTGTNVARGDNSAGFMVGVRPLVGKRYFEVRIDALAIATNTGYVGIVEAGQRVYYQSFNFPERPSSIGYRQNGEIRGNSSTILGSGPLYAAGDILMVACDPTAKTVQFGKNGAWQASTYALTGTITGLYPAFSLRDQGDVVTLIGNAADFTYSPPPGYSDLAA